MWSRMPNGARVGQTEGQSLGILSPRAGLLSSCDISPHLGIWKLLVGHPHQPVHDLDTSPSKGSIDHRTDICVQSPNRAFVISD